MRCPRCYAPVSFTDGKPLPHRLPGGPMCGGFVHRLVNALTPERPPTTLARLHDWHGRLVTDLLFAGDTAPAVVKWVPPLDDLAAMPDDRTSPLRYFRRVGAAPVTDDDGGAYWFYTERDPHDAAPNANEPPGAVINTRADTEIASPSDLAQTVSDWLFGRGRK